MFTLKEFLFIFSLKNWKEGETDVQACRVNRRRRDKKIIVHTSILCLYVWIGRWTKLAMLLNLDLPFEPFLNNIPNFLPSLQSTYIFKIAGPYTIIFLFWIQKVFYLSLHPRSRCFFKNYLVFRKRMGAMCWVVTVAGVSGSLYPFRKN